MTKDERKTIKNFVNNFDDAKILEFSNFRRTLQNVANSGLNLYGFPEVPLRLEWGSTDAPVAYMSNTECYINLNSDLDQGLSLPDRKRNAIGKLTHEVFGHGLFSDFSIMNEINNATDFNMLKKYFSHTSVKKLKEIEEYYKQIPGAVNNIFLQLNNIIEDPVIECLALQRYPGLADYVEFTKEQLTKECKTHIEESLSNDMGFMNAFLMQMRNIEVETATLYFPELIKTQVVYDNIENMPHSYQRFEATGYVFTVFWELLKPIFDAVIAQKGFLDLLQKLNLPRTQNGMANQQDGDAANGSQCSISISCNNNSSTSSRSNESNDDTDENNSSNSVNSSNNVSGDSTNNENNNDSVNTTNNGSYEENNDSSNESNDCLDCSDSNNEDDKIQEDKLTQGDNLTDNKEDDSNADDAEESNGSNSTNDDITDTQDEDTNEDGSNSNQGCEDENEDENNSDLNNSNDENSNDSQNNEPQDKVNNANQPIDSSQVDPNTQREFEKQLSQMEKEVNKNRGELSTQIAAEHPELLKQAEHFELNNGNGFAHEGYSIVVNVPQVKNNAIEDYNSLFKPEYKRISQVLAKKLNQIIKQKRTYKALYELEEGSMIDINAYAQGSDKVFMDFSNPYKNPVCAISVMIDLSGSMSGDRIHSAMLTSMVLENFARNSKIPIEIYGHHSISYKKTSIERFVGFNEKSSVATASKLISCLSLVNGCNRDGLAIRYGLAKLKKRPEKSKLMFILSDGNPNNDGYGTRAMKSEMPDIYKIAKKYNVQIIPVAIGDDISSLRDIYGNNIIDGRDLNQLPQMLTNKAFKNINKFL